MTEDRSGARATPPRGARVPIDPRVTRYEDRGSIGRGGMSDVRQVYDRELDRLLAMKILSRELIDDAWSRARFLAEARVTASLQHPGIVAVHDQGTLEDGRPWFTMREVRGRTLSEVIDALHEGIRDGAWPTEPISLFRVVDTFRRLCDAVAYAHSRGVVHRDLKPSNLMVGEFGEVQVMDWGLAKEVAGAPPAIENADPLATQVGDVVGTPSYMAPEQARGEHDSVGPRADVWALGAVLRTILTNRPPVEGSTPVVIATILLGDIKPIARVVGPRHPPMPEELLAICERAMRFDANERYADAGEIAEELGAWLEGARRRETALAIVEEADALAPRIRELREEAEAHRQRARALLDLPANASAEAKHAGWDEEDRARALEREASLRAIEWRERLHSALHVVPDLPEAHDRLADHYRDRLLEAEGRRDPDEAAKSEALLRAHDRGRHAAFLAGDGAVTLLTDPPGARVTAYRYVERHRRLVPERVRELGVTPVIEASLPHGSYLLEMELEGRPPVRYPVLIERGACWDGVPPGASEPYAIPVPTAEELGGDLVYVPAGWFWSGGDPRAVDSLPRRRIWIDGLLAGRHPITNAEYVAFLNHYVERGEEELALRHAPRAPVGTDGEAERLALGRSGDGRFVLADGDIIGPADWPITLVNWHSAKAFAEWRSTGERSFRLPNELEWEKLARGTDGRFFAFGDHVEPSWACIMGSAKGTGPGRVSIHNFPSDESPYGARGLTGNVRDWCSDLWRADGPRVADGRVVSESDEAGGLRVARGGAWHTVPELARAAGRFAGDAHRRFTVAGFRVVCAR